jgi:UDP-galactose transporter
MMGSDNSGVRASTEQGNIEESIMANGVYDGKYKTSPQIEAAVSAGFTALEVKPKAKDDTSQENRFKWFVLIFLVLQNSSASILMRYSRSETGASWNPQTGVVMQEVVKAVTCIFLLLKDGTLLTVFADRREALKTSIPAICYLIQNNLQYVAVGYLDASTYAVLYQLKILTTALLSVVILRKDLACIQWVSLALLTVGVCGVVLSQMSEDEDKQASKSVDKILPGLVAVLTACLMSGLAGVYFEKLLKGSTVSLWARNLQLALYSIVIGLCGLYGESSEFSLSDFFHGYTTAVWLSILNNAFGGLLVAVVIKYADVILKNFSASLSIVLTAMVSSFGFGSTISIWFCLGTALVIYAMFLYGKVNPMDLAKKFIALDAMAGK